MKGIDFLTKNPKLYIDKYQVKLLTSTFAASAINKQLPSIIIHLHATIKPSFAH